MEGHEHTYNIVECILTSWHSAAACTGEWLGRSDVELMFAKQAPATKKHDQPEASMVFARDRLLEIDLGHAFNSFLGIFTPLQHFPPLSS